MSAIITESDMDFIADNVFHIEKSAVYTNLKKEQVKTVEFVRAKEGKLLFVEAKSSFPNPNISNTENLDEFQSQVEILCEKFIHSLNVYTSIAIGVNGQLPPDFKPTHKVSISFVVVFNNFEKRWCSPIQKAVLNKLSESICIAKVWKPEVFVINDEIAKQRNLISSNK